jgi:hypothetical protein
MARGHVKSGMRDDLGVHCRSGWEASTLRWLSHQGIAWEFEPRRFDFPGEKRGAKSYLPDIWLPKKKKWIEVKGRLMSSDKTRIRRFKKHYPEEFARLVAIPGSRGDEAAQFFEKMEVPIMAYFRELNKEFKDVVPHWNE